MTDPDKISVELKKIDSLLQDKSFTEAMAIELEAAYYKGIGEIAPPFLQPGEDVLLLNKSIEEVTIATKISGLYALESGLNYLCSRDNTTPAAWIEKIVSQKMDDEKDAVEILNRFANAAWKAGQPFRSLDRIKKSNFIGWNGLTPGEIKKDYWQIMEVAVQLQPLIKGGTNEQWMQIKNLLQHKDFAISYAASINTAYTAGEKKAEAPFHSNDDTTGTIKKSFKEEKIATSIAGFYGLECGVNYFTKLNKQSPSSILLLIINESLPKEDKRLYCRFANTTWKAGQPFKSLDRITREQFTPFNFLTEKDIEKDWVQVKTAAAILLEELK